MTPAMGASPSTAPGMRVLRGGGFADSPETLNPALRHGEQPERRFRWNGLRLARSVAACRLTSRGRKLCYPLP